MEFQDYKKQNVVQIKKNYFIFSMIFLSLTLFFLYIGDAAAEQEGTCPTPLNASFLTTLDANGKPLSTFNVGLIGDQAISFIKVDASGNIWVGLRNTNQDRNQFTPDDSVVKFTPAGIKLMIVKGPMKSPESIAFDSDGNIYIGGLPDGGNLTAWQIYKYNSDGVFLSSFGDLSNTEFLGASYKALEFDSTDRLFATTANPHSIQEFTTEGDEVKHVTSFDETFRIGISLALSADGETLWNYQPQNGPGENFIVAYDLNLNILSFFGLNTFGNPDISGLDTLPNGNIVVRDRTNNSRILEFSTTGILIKEIDISSIDSGTRPADKWGFAVDNNGNFIVNHTHENLIKIIPIDTTGQIFANHHTANHDAAHFNLKGVTNIGVIVKEALDNGDIFPLTFRLGLANESSIYKFIAENNDHVHVTDNRITIHIPEKNIHLVCLFSTEQCIVNIWRANFDNNRLDDALTGNMILTLEIANTHYSNTNKWIQLDGSGRRWTKYRTESTTTH